MPAAQEQPEWLTGDQSWHALTADAVLARLGADSGGLGEAAVQERRASFGPNLLPAAKPRSALLRFLSQFDNLLIHVLLASAVITAVLGHAVDTTVILAVVIANAIIGFLQEGRAERALDAIRAMVTPQASVLRDGSRKTVAAEDLVPGDIVLLDAGDRVPADLRLVHARNLRIDESILTGESVGAEKTIEPVITAAVVADRCCMAFSGTMVTAGLGRGVVVGTGMHTQLGKVSELLSRVETLTTPLVRQMERFARRLTVVILMGCTAVFAFAGLARSYPWADAFMTVVGLAVSAIPEGLPAVMTITLAIGVQRMAARHAIIRRLPAVETLGSVSTICSDKTGTLTRNEMTVRSVATAMREYQVTGVGYEPRGVLRVDGDEIDVADDAVLMQLARAALLCNDAELRHKRADWSVQGDPMEGALVSFAVKAGCDAALTRKQYPRSDEIPFDAQHRFMATLHHSHEGRAFLYVKGAPERVIDMCVQQRGENGDEPIDHAYWDSRISKFANAGQRVLAVASKPMPTGAHHLRFHDAQNDLSLLALFGLIDPPREEAIAAVRDCRSAGIQVKMITGDHADTAAAIAEQLELADQIVVATGEDIDALNDQALRRVVRDTNVFARTSPEHKLRLVTALQAEGAVVAMTGDGVNDAPALKRADVGVAMGRHGTEAAKQAAEVVLADDNFASIVAAVREGRTVYDNLKKVIGWTLPTNGGEALTIIGAIALGLTLPVTPVQILWINMVTVIALGLTLAFEPAEALVMQRPPRAAEEPLLSGFLVWRICLVSVLFVVGVFSMYRWALIRGLSIEEVRTIVVNTIVVMEVFYLFSVRYLHITSLTWRGLLGTRAVLIGVAVVTAAQFAFTYLPSLQAWFVTRPIAPLDGLCIVAVGVALLMVLEIEKALWRSWSARR